MHGPSLRGADRYAQPRRPVSFMCSAGRVPPSTRCPWSPLGGAEHACHASTLLLTAPYSRPPQCLPVAPRVDEPVSSLPPALQDFPAGAALMLGLQGTCTLCGLMGAWDTSRGCFQAAAGGPVALRGGPGPQGPPLLSRIGTHSLGACTRWLVPRERKCGQHDC